VKSKPWLFVGLAVVIAGAAILALWQYRHFSVQSAGDMVSVLPSKDAILFFVDVNTLRRTGFLEKLAANKVTEDQEYKDFVAQTHFNYERDLDRIVGSVQKLQNGSAVYYLTLDGRFDWSQLTLYVKRHNGDCIHSLCSVPATKPGWWISYLPIHSKLMGLAYSTEKNAAYGFDVGRNLKPQSVPPGFAWLTIPQSALSNVAAPAQTSGAGSSLSTLRSILATPKQSTFSLTAAPDSTSGAELHFKADLASEASALALENQLVQATDVVRQTASEKGASKDTAALANVLSSGHFSRSATQVRGVWVVSPAFLDAITQ
jgi:hypothetical protein